MKTIDPIREIANAIAMCGSQKLAAKSLGVSAAYLGDVLHGKRMPGPKLLTAMGLKKTTVFTRTDVPNANAAETKSGCY